MGSAYLVELPNENNRFEIHTSVAGILDARYIKIENGILELVDIDMSENISQYDYNFSENSTHALIITSGYTGQVSQEILINISFENQIIIGDINNDFEINILDIVNLVEYILNNNNLTDEQFESSDLNQDEVINIIDIIFLVNIILGD